MARFFLTNRARDDLVEIWRRIAAGNPGAADSTLDRIEDASTRLARHPELGQARPDIRPELRYFVVSPYLLLYRTAGRDVEIVRVVHGRRDLFNLD
ncbi:MAG: plasmid stabilization protein [Alphaproteobacteria bacterium HGW-Alphaproteobacteria-12]|nr:MAG: plasmid stabilization protein [Alphaproteobacteria bacterium HGW-Alphaproteobacteria-12]